ncbi:MAG: hypothetical protein FJY48_12455 [Betaproteobacteria bacterium]|nr:hypothetical protein [Betaproteobacteria bacterium]
MSYVYPRQFFGFGQDGKLAATIENEQRFSTDKARATFTANKREAYFGAQQALAVPDQWTRPIELLAEIVASTPAPGAYRWIYTVKKVELIDPVLTLAANTRISDDVSQEVDASIPKEFVAWNLYELKHGGLYFGDGTLVANLPAGAVLTPVQGVVLCHGILDNATNQGSILRYVFDRANGVECAPGE